MKYIAYTLGSTTSAGKKHYTVLLTDTGYLLTHYGTRTPTRVGGNVLLKPSAGKVVIAEIEPDKLEQIPERMNATYLRKKNNGDYDTLAHSLRGNNTYEDVPYMDETVARKVLNDFHNKVASGLPATRNDLGTSLPAHTIERFISTSIVRDKAQDTALPKARTGSAKAKAKEKEEFFYTDTNGKVYRPNGEEYLPREIMGHTDVALLRGFREKGIFVRLAGPPGGGKTALTEGAFGDEIITITGHGDMTVANFVGSWLPRRDRKVGESEWEWHDGPLLRAMKGGKVFFVDEGTRIPADVLNILFSVMDGRNMLRIDDRPDLPVVHGKEGFYVVMGYNPDTLGARVLDEALVSRFRVEIIVKTDVDTAKALKVPAVALKVFKAMEQRDSADRNNGGPGVWVPQMRELLTFKSLVDAKVGVDFALSNMLASCPNEMDIPALKEAIRDVSNRAVTHPILGGLV